MTEEPPKGAEAISDTLYRYIVENSADGIVIITEDGRIAYLNVAAQKMFGHSLRRLRGRPIEVLMPEDFRAGHAHHVEAFRRSGEHSRSMSDRLLHTFGLRADGRKFPADISILKTTAGAEPVYIAIVRDVSKHVALEAKLEKLANTDPLTGIANRRAFLARAEQEFEAARRYKLDLSLAMVDIDRFKAFNDRFGHATGDQVLIGVAHHLASNLRKPDLIARWGGEEFICLLPHTSADVALAAAERLRQSVQELAIPETAAGAGSKPAKVTVSIGLASIERSGVERPSVERSGSGIDALIEQADQALYAAKAAGRDRVVLHRADRRTRPGTTRKAPPDR